MSDPLPHGRGSPGSMVAPVSFACSTAHRSASAADSDPSMPTTIRPCIPRAYSAGYAADVVNEGDRAPDFTLMSDAGEQG